MTGSAWFYAILLGALAWAAIIAAIIAATTI